MRQLGVGAAAGYRATGAAVVSEIGEPQNFVELARRHGGAAAVRLFAARAQQPEQVRVLMNVGADDPEAPARESGHATGLAVMQADIFCNTRQKSAFL